MASMASKRVLPLVAPALVSLFHPLYQGMLADSSNMLSPCHPEMGTKGTDLGLYPTFLMKPEASLTISSYRSPDHCGREKSDRQRRVMATTNKPRLTLQVSILLMATMSCLTPRVKASKACSLVCPSLEIPASNSPIPEAMIKMAQSAWEVPVIMFLIKSR